MKNDIKPSAQSFNNFWESSTYSRFNIKEFASVQEQYNAKDKITSLLEYPAKPQKLPLPKTLANYLGRRRKSEREFSDKPLSKNQLGKLLSSFYAHNGLEHRSYPSAGGSYALEVFCIANNVSGFSNKILYYNPDNNGVSIIGDAPSWSELSPNVNVEITGTPQCLLIFSIFSERLTAKYLERGGRFSLIEVGAAMQQLAIQVAGTRKLKGVAVGGLVDDFWLKTLGLKKSEAKIAVGYICGK